MTHGRDRDARHDGRAAAGDVVCRRRSRAQDLATAFSHDLGHFRSKFCELTRMSPQNIATSSSPSGYGSTKARRRRRKDH